MSKGKMTVYLCGGAGVNVGKALMEKSKSFNSNAFADRELYFIDTSKSNLAKVDDADNIYLYEDVDGAGKVRKHVSEPVVESIKDVLLKFKPGDVSVVVSSTSGGSGSVIGPSIVSELLARKEPVIYIGIVASDSRLEVKNNIDTIRSFAKIAKVRERPVVGALFENTKEKNQMAVNKDIVSTIIMLSVLFSKNNEGLDTQDLRNWLNFSHVTDFEPSFAYLSVQIGKVDKSRDNHLISAAILSPSRDVEHSLDFSVEYQTVGYFNKEDGGGQLSDEAVKFLIYTGPNESLYKKQEKLMEEMVESANARINKNTINVSSIDAEDNGLVF